MSKLFNCVLPPLPMPLSEMRTLVLLTTAFGKLWEVELKGTRFKIGDPCPEKLKDWFIHGDNEPARILQGAPHCSIKARGADVQQFHLERDTDQLQSLLDAQEEGREERPEPEQQREDVDEQQRRVEQQRLMEAQRLADGQRKKAKTFELGLKKRMSVGDLLTMHKEAKTYNEKTIVQVVEKHYEDNGRLKSLSQSDGSNVSHNVIPMNDAAAEGMNEFRKFELMEINLVHIKKDSLILEDIDQLRLQAFLDAEQFKNF